MRRTLLLLIGVTLASGTVYPVRMVFDSPTMEAMSEGVMWGTGQSPVGSKPSMIDVQLDAAALGGRTSRVGVLITSQVDLAEQLSVDPALRPLLLCQKDYATANFTAHFYDVPSKIHVTHEVERTGVELVMLYVCPGDDAGGSMSPVRFDGSIAFRNPYGYLAAATFGFLPYFAALAALYLVTGVAYCCVLALNRAFVSRLQWLVLAIFVLGFVETAATNSFEFVTGTTVFSKACGYYTSAKETNALKVRPSRGQLCLLRTERGFLPAFALTRTRASSGVVTQHTVRVCCVCFREEARSLLRNTRVGPSPPLGIPSRFPRACGFPARCSF